MGKLGILGSRWGVDGASQIVESWAYLKGQHEKSYKSYKILAWPQIIMYPNSLHLIFYKMLQLTCHVNDLSRFFAQWIKCSDFICLTCSWISKRVSNKKKLLFSK